MASTDSKATALWGVAHRITFPILDADGDLVTGATGLDSEISKDGGTFADCTNEATEIATSSGVYYLDLTAAEMEADQIAIIVKTSSSGAKTTVVIIYPERGIRTRKAQAGAAGTITLDASANASDDYYNKSIVVIVGGTGVGQARMISDYVGSTKVASVIPNWVTNPSTDSIFQIIPAGRVDVGMWVDSAPNALVSGRVDASVGAMAAAVLTATAIATDAITAAKLATDAITAAKIAADAIAEIQAGLATAAAVAALPTAAAIRAEMDSNSVDLNTIIAGLVAINADTDDIQARLPAALVGGRMDASVGAMGANVLTAAALATDAVNEIADGLLSRDVDQVEAGAAIHSLASAVLKLVSRFKATTGQTYRTDGTTVHMTQTPVNDPVTAISELGVAG